MKRTILFIMSVLFVPGLTAQEKNDPSRNQFRQMRTEFSTPNAYRTASGAPGQLYWQQEANYRIRVTLDDENQKITGRESIEYINHSPDVLNYLWIQLDQNIRQKESLSELISTGTIDERIPFSSLGRFMSDFEGGFNLEYVRDADGNPLTHTVNYTMMRVDLPSPLQPGEKYLMDIGWWYNINDRMKDGGGRSGMEYFESDGNYIYTIAQFFPRMAVYSEVEGWQNNQFLGRTEFALPFGNYEVEITVPADHVVGATGILLNPEEVLSPSRLERFRNAHGSSDAPVFIVTEEEARAAEKKRSGEARTWKFRAENVRDFAFASSRKFIWDAMAVAFGDRTVLAQSLYPREGNPLWEKYSTRVVAHTLKVYSRHTFDFPYPVAYSVHTNNIGMEYPMVSFNGGRPEPDGTYSERTKFGMLGVIIHEVGHNFFPMIVNSDERQWTWMDEGLNTFLQGIAQREWDHDWPAPEGRPRDIVDYMRGDQSNIAPIMINGELTMQFSNNAYDKPAVGLNILRETVMGRELFDFAFQQYARRWMFRHPTPEDLFRTLEDASGVDLDWFWRGWFYGTDPVDISLDRVKFYRAATGDPAKEKAFMKKKLEEEPEEIAVTRNREVSESMVEADPSLHDFYDNYDAFKPTAADREAYRRYLDGLTGREKAWIASDKYYYQLDFTNLGGMVMPLILRFEFEAGETELIRIPAQIWSRNNHQISRSFIFDRPVVSVTLDPFLETADIHTENNHWPPRMEERRFDLYKRSYRDRMPSNPMQEQ
ncbi:MAG TPA: M1 family peptidase [Bacteroides sp.]|nr:M1 family peptidase [Bacteroides sp.]